MATKKRATGSKKDVGACETSDRRVAEPQSKFAPLGSPSPTAAPDSPRLPRKRDLDTEDSEPPVESLKRATDARDLERAIAGGYVTLRAYIQLRAARAVNLVFEATEIGLASGQMSPGTVGGAKLVLEHALTEPLDVKLGKPNDSQRKLVDRVQALSAIEAQLARESDSTH